MCIFGILAVWMCTSLQLRGQQLRASRQGEMLVVLWRRHGVKYPSSREGRRGVLRCSEGCCACVVVLLEEKYLFSVSPCWRTAFISESQLDVASLEFYPDEHKSLCISNCFNRGSHQCSVRPLRKTRIHVHFLPDKSLLYHKTPLTTLDTSSSTAEKNKI